MTVPPESGKAAGDPDRHAKNAPYPDAKVARDLGDCENLISYAAQHGKPILPADAAAIATALNAQRNRKWDADIQGAFYAAMSRIAQAAVPVTAECLGPRAEKAAEKVIAVYSWGTIVLAVVVVGLSCLLLVLNQIADDIGKLVDENDKMALLMHNELQAHILTVLDAKSGGPAAGDRLVNSQSALALKEHIQQFATNNRRLLSDVERLNIIWRWPWQKRRPLEAWNRYGGGCTTAVETQLSSLFVYAPNAFGFVVPLEAAQKPMTNWLCDADSIRRALEIKLPLLRVGSVDQEELQMVPRPQVDVQQGFQKIAVYQDIRSMALRLRDMVAGVGGSTSGFLLPVLYAWLGACAHILRQLKSESADKTFHPVNSKLANRAQVATAIIVGITIGLFTNFLQGGKDASPLALAFVGGYASDKFFEFVERIVRAIFPPEGSPPRTTKP